MDAIIVEKSDGSEHRQSIRDLQLDEASVVKLPIAPENVASFEQNGNDLMIVTADGKTIVIGDFFVAFGDERNELVLVDDDGIAWWGQYAGQWSDFAFAEIGADSVGAFPWGALGGLGAASAGGLAVAGDGGSETAAAVFPTLDVEQVADDPAAAHVRVTGHSTGDYVVVSYPDGNGNIVKSEPIPVGDDGSWSYDIPRGDIAEGDVDITGTVTDPQGNPVPGDDGNPVSDTETATLDLTGPEVGVVITDNGQDGTLVLTFSPDTDRASFDPTTDLALDNANLDPAGGTWSTDGDGNQVWTTTITPTGTGEVTATVTDGSYTDTAGNEGSEGADSESFDVDAPSVIVDIVNEGQTGTVTFTFSEAVTGFDASDVSVANGTLSNLTRVSDTTWTATVTPTATGDVTVEVADKSYADLAGNAGTKGSDTDAFDRTAPTVGVVITDNGQDGTLVLTFSPDTDRVSFDPTTDLALDNANLDPAGGTWSTDGDGNQVWTTTITPTGTGEVTATVIDGSYTDTAGNEGSEGADSESFDVSAPSVIVDIVNEGQTGTVTFTFSEAVTGFDASDVSVANGTLSNLTRVNDTTWTATVTPTATGDVTVEVADKSYADLAGNAGTKGADTDAFDRTAPTVGVVITDNGQDGTLVLTFSPDTDRVSFDPTTDLALDNANLDPAGGTWSTDGDGNQVWTTTITPTGTGEVTATVTDGSYTDTAGNEGSEGADSESFDVSAPSVIVDIVNEGQTGTVTFTFSEAVTGFDASDVSVANGTLSNLTRVSDTTWTATVTPAATGDVTVEVADKSYADLAGNAGTKGADTDAFDRTAPTVGVVITDNGQDGTLVLTFSPDTDRASFDPTTDLALDNANLDPAGGTWSTDGDGNQVWTTTITPTGTGEVTATVTDGSYTDTAGNEGSEGADSESFDVSAPSVIVDIVNEGQTGTVTFTFSEAVTGFDASDVSVANGTLSNLTRVSDTTWTATVTPEKAGGDVTVTVADKSYADLAGNAGAPGSDTEGFARTAPLANDDNISLTLAGDDFKSDKSFNIAFVLDFSGSVDNTEARAMLNAVKVAGQSFFEGTTGDVQIQLVAFSSDARSTVSFTSYDAFAAQVDAWSASRPYNSGTDYTAGIQKTIETYTPLDGYDNRVFFMSDGEPTEQTQQHWGNNGWEVDHSLTSATASAWDAFVADNDITVQTVGIGQGISVERLQDVDEADGDNHVVEVSNFDVLIDSLLDLLKEVDVSGNVLRGADNIAGTADDDLLGIDGGRILSISVDGETYTYDLHGITDSHGGAVADGSILTVETDQGGKLIFDFETGDWTYKADAETGAGLETFNYVLTDDSDDTSNAALEIDVHSDTSGAAARSMAFDTGEVSSEPAPAPEPTLHIETLGLAALDAEPADDKAAEVPTAENIEVNADDLVYDDKAGSLDAYLPEENHATQVADGEPTADAGTISVDLNELEDHAMLVG